MYPQLQRPKDLNQTINGGTMRAEWLYSVDDPAETIQISKDWGITDVLWGSYGNQKFLDLAHRQEMRVHAMCLQDTYFTYQHDRALDQIKRYLDMGVDGLHLDTEFWCIPEWQQKGM